MNNVKHYKVFFVTPFGDNNDQSSQNVYAVRDAILKGVDAINKQAKMGKNDFTLDLVRADLDNLHNELSENLEAMMIASELFVCDITGSNPNVMYEIGYGRALKKRNTNH